MHFLDLQQMDRWLNGCTPFHTMQWSPTKVLMYMLPFVCSHFRAFLVAKVHVAHKLYSMARNIGGK